MQRQALWLAAALLTCFMPGTLAQAPAPATAGSATTSPPVATPAPIIAPAMLIPSLLGARLYAGISPAVFRGVVLGLLTLSGVALLAAAVPVLIRR